MVSTIKKHKIVRLRDCLPRGRSWDAILSLVLMSARQSRLRWCAEGSSGQAGLPPLQGRAAGDSKKAPRPRDIA